MVFDLLWCAVDGAVVIMAFARQHDGVARFGHTRTCGIRRGTDFAPSANRLHECSSEEPSDWIRSVLHI
jgi:hypothetical protein